jgi:hypothetical protein
MGSPELESGSERHGARRYQPPEHGEVRRGRREEDSWRKKEERKINKLCRKINR